MSKSNAARGIAARTPQKKFSRKVTPRGILGAVALGCFAAGSGLIVYSTIFMSSVYPRMDGAFDEAAGNSARQVAGRPSPARIAGKPASNRVASTRAVSVSPPSPAPASSRHMLASDEVSRQDFAARFDAGGPVASEAYEPDEVQVAAPVSREMFNARFAAAVGENNDVIETHEGSAEVRIADVVRQAPAPKRSQPAQTQLALNEQPQTMQSRSAARDSAKAAVMSITPEGRQSMVEKLWGKPQSSGLLAYAMADESMTASIAPREQNPMFGGAPPYDRTTAVYDISARTVYLPDGSKLEAHSGLGVNQDNPRSASIRMRGVTPPHIYSLKPRESLFHGVPALRLTPMGGEKAIYGRDGLLAHTFMLGSKGASNGCVSFRNYYAFLDAYRNKGIRKIAVVARVD
ncbi:MAG: DUF2778 domain-containing protein [Alphaproteobacteria bacterium]|nr:DUF2778 domain-containing protein [Alphaproteobacteria bacterium]